MSRTSASESKASSLEAPTFASLILNAKFPKEGGRFFQIGTENALGHSENPLDAEFVPFLTYAIKADGPLITLRVAEAGGQLFIKNVHVRPDLTATSIQIGIKEEGKAF